MNKLSLSLLALLIAAAAFAMITWRKQKSLGSENQQLQARVSELEQDLAKATSDTSTGDLKREAQAQKLELMRLRNEVSQLRADRQADADLESELDRLRTENQQLRAERRAASAHGSPDPPEPSRDRFPAEQWQYTGLATPESALTSALWELKHGQLPTESSLAADPGQFAAWRQKIAGASAVQIMERHEPSPGEFRLKLFLEGPAVQREFTLTREGSNWRLANVQDAAANDPMQFYLQNPELMRRYFPHLVPQNTAAADGAAE